MSGRFQLVGRHFALGALLIAGMATPSPARAYRTAADLPEFDGSDRVVWRHPAVLIELHDFEVDGIDREAAVAAIEAAIAVWNDVECADVSVSYEGASSLAAAPADGVNTIEFVTDWAARGYEADAGATTDIRFLEDGSGWFIAEADIYVNAERMAFGDATELRAFLVHEFGHVLGLLHPCELGAADPSCRDRDMRSVLYPTSQRLRSLSDDDIAGACSLYPVVRDCDRSCPAGFGCVNGDCLPNRCESDEECPSERCTEGRCQAFSPSLADPCAADDECASGLCAVGGFCSQTCTGHDQCPEDWRCERSTCHPDDNVFSDDCTGGHQCQSRICLQDTETDDICTRECEPGECPSGYHCELIDGRDVCAPPREDTGCRAGSQTAPPLCLLLLLALLRKR